MISHEANVHSYGTNVQNGKWDHMDEYAYFYMVAAT